MPNRLLKFHLKRTTRDTKEQTSASHDPSRFTEKYHGVQQTSSRCAMQKDIGNVPRNKLYVEQPRIVLQGYRCASKKCETVPGDSLKYSDRK